MGLRDGNIDKVRDYAEKQHYDVNASYYASDKQWSEKTALTFLAYVGYDANDQLRIAKLLLDNGADPNIGKGDALAHAVFQKDTSLVEFLLENGADPNIKRERYGYITYPLLDAVKTAIRDWQVDAKGIVLTRLLIEHGADINAKNEEGQTALMLVKEAVMKDELGLSVAEEIMESLGVSEEEIKSLRKEKESKTKPNV